MKRVYNELEAYIYNISTTGHGRSLLKKLSKDQQKFNKSIIYSYLKNA